MKKTSLSVQLLTLAPILVIPAVVVFLANLILSEQKTNYEMTIAQLEQDFVESEKSRIRSKVNNMVDLVSYRHSIINKELHDRIRFRVDDAQKTALALYDFYKDTKSDDEIKRLIIESLRPLSWNDSESYIWIIDFDGILQLGPSYLRPMESKSIIEFKDDSGREIIKEEIAIVTSQGRGYLWDSFTKPGEPADKQFKQLAYVKKFEAFDWYLGSAEFLDTATKSTHSELLEAINQVGKGDTDYIFVLDKAGNLLLNYARPDIVGRNMSETTDKNLHKLFNMMISAGDSSRQEFIKYNWLNPKTGMVDFKMAYLKSVPGSDWVIGSGFYPKMLEQGYDAKLQRLTTEYKQKREHFTTLMWLSILASIVLAGVMSMTFYQVIKNYRSSLENSSKELKSLNLELEQELIEKNRALEKAEKQLDDELNLQNLNAFASQKITISRLDEEIQRATVYQLPLSASLMSITNLQEIRLSIDSIKFDQLLLSIANHLTEFSNDKELSGRISNDQLFLIMPELDTHEAEKQVQTLVADFKSLFDDQSITIEINYQITEFQANDTSKSILARLGLKGYV